MKTVAVKQTTQISNIPKAITQDNQTCQNTSESQQVFTGKATTNQGRVIHQITHIMLYATQRNQKRCDKYTKS